jgi:hypothetical protein
VNASSADDCFFDVCNVSSAPGQEQASTVDRLFPKSLGPFGLAVTDMSPELNFATQTFSIKTANVFQGGKVVSNPQLEKLQELELLPLVSNLCCRTALALFSWMVDWNGTFAFVVVISSSYCLMIACWIRVVGSRRSTV